MGIQPVGREHHEDEVGVELLLLFFHTAIIVIVRFHTCMSKSVSLENAKKNCTKIVENCKDVRTSRADFSAGADPEKYLWGGKRMAWSL